MNHGISQKLRTSVKSSQQTNYETSHRGNYLNSNLLSDTDETKPVLRNLKKNLSASDGPVRRTSHVRQVLVGPSGEVGSPKEQRESLPPRGVFGIHPAGAPPPVAVRYERGPQLPKILPSVDLGPRGAPRLVIALDYGTTYTGVAFAFANSNTASLQIIEVLQDWGKRMGNQQKLPSVISYSKPEHEEQQQWGSDISDNSVTMVHMKLELDELQNPLDELLLTLQVLVGTSGLDFESIQNLDSEPEYTSKSPGEVVTDYLTKVFNVVHGNERIRLAMHMPTIIVITTPVNWSYQAINTTFRAVQKAGFNERNFPALSQILSISEPEAASHFSVHRLVKETDGFESLKPGDIFILCDAGGGTVDLVAIQIKQIHPQIEMERVTDPTSGKFGSAYVNTYFLRWLRCIIGPVHFAILDSSNSGQYLGTHSTESPLLRRLMRDFEKVKRAYTGKQDCVRLDLPGGLSSLNIPGYVEDGQLSISQTDMTQIFDPCVDNIINLIKQQRVEVETKKQRKVKNVFLVGGFGLNVYLKEQLKISMEWRGITLRQEPDDSMTAVVQGAVVYGIENGRHSDVRVMAKSTYSYGIVIDEPFSRHKHEPQDCSIDQLTHAKMARNQFVWLIRSGDVVLSDGTQIAEKEFIINFEAQRSSKFQLPIYRYNREEDEVPTRWDTGQYDVRQIGSVGCRVQNIPPYSFETHLNSDNEKEYCIAYPVCKMRIMPGCLNVVVLNNGTSIGEANINLNSDAVR